MQEVTRAKEQNQEVARARELGQEVADEESEELSSLFKDGPMSPLTSSVVQRGNLPLSVPPSLTLIPD